MEPRRRTQSLVAYERLRVLLITGQLPGGTRLREEEWSEQLGVNRVALREAMSLLAHEGLLTPGQRGGYFTPLLERRDVEELMQLRAFLEVGAVRLIGSRKRTEAERAKLAGAVKSLEHMADSGFVRGYNEADMRFHETLVELSGNQRLITAYHRLAIHLLQHLITLSFDMKADIESHRCLQELIWERKISEATALLERHLGVMEDLRLVPPGAKQTSTEKADV